MRAWRMTCRPRPVRGPLSITVRAEARANVAIHLGTTGEALGERSAQLWNGSGRRDGGNIGLVVPTRMLLPAPTVADAPYERAPALDAHVLRMRLRYRIQRIREAADIDAGG